MKQYLSISDKLKQEIKLWGISLPKVFSNPPNENDFFLNLNDRYHEFYSKKVKPKIKPPEIKNEEDKEVWEFLVKDWEPFECNRDKYENFKIYYEKEFNLNRRKVKKWREVCLKSVDWRKNIKKIYEDYLNETINRLESGYNDVINIYGFISSKNKDSFIKSKTLKVLNLKEILNIKRNDELYPSYQINWYLDKERFNTYIEIWNNRESSKESLEDIILFKKLLPLCFDTLKIKNDNLEFEKNMKKYHKEQEFGNSQNNIYDKTNYNKDLDLDQQDPEFWVSF